MEEQEKGLSGTDWLESQFPESSYENGDLEEFEQVMLEDLLAKVKLYKSPDALMEANSPKSKWRLASCMQKGIRRGDPAEAVNAAHALHMIEPAYAYYRAGITALEDVGPGDFSLAVYFSLDKVRKVTERRKLGLEEQILLYLVDRMARAASSRACSNLCTISNRALKGVKAKQSSWAGDASLPLAVRLRAAFKEVTPPTWKESLAKFPLLNQDALAFCVSTIVCEGAGGAMARMVPFVLEAMDRSGDTIKVTEPEVPSAPKIGKLFAPTYDMHTREGKAAVHALGKMLRHKIQEILMESLSDKQLDNIIERLCFIHESSVMSPYFSMPVCNEWMEWSDRVEQEDFKIPASKQQACKELFLAHVEDLHDLRRKYVLGLKG